MMRILITGFEPFGGSSVNPSLMLARAISQEEWPGAIVSHAILPVIGGEGPQSCRAALREAIDFNQPSVVVCFGESAKATHVCFERVAVNLRDDRIADNAGVQCQDLSVVADGPVAYFSSLPVRAMRDACEGEGIPALLSMSAGTFLCNEIMYTLLHGIEVGEFQSVTSGGFIHIPQLPEQATERGGPSIELRHILVGVRASFLTLISPLG
jgi:pyroglutamyl-peptidase